MFAAVLGLALGISLWFVYPQDQFLALTHEVWISVAGGMALLVWGWWGPRRPLHNPCAREDSCRAWGVRALAVWGAASLAAVWSSGRLASGSAAGGTALACAALGIWIAQDAPRAGRFAAALALPLHAALAVGFFRWATVLRHEDLLLSSYALGDVQPFGSKTAAGILGAALFAFWAPLVLRGRAVARLLPLLPAAAGGAAALLAHSTTALLSLACGIVTRVPTRRARPAVIACVGFAAVAVSLWADPLLSEHPFRLKTWSRCVTLATGRPLLGYGPGSFHGAFDAPAADGSLPDAVYARQEAGWQVTHAHCAPLQIAVESGIPAAAAYMAALAAAILCGVRAGGVRAGGGAALAALAGGGVVSAEGGTPGLMLQTVVLAGWLLSPRDGAPVPAVAAGPAGRLLLIVGAGLLLLEGGRMGLALRDAVRLDPSGSGRPARGRASSSPVQVPLLPDSVDEQRVLWESAHDLARRPARAEERLVRAGAIRPTAALAYWEAQVRMGVGNPSGAADAFSRCAAWWSARPELYHEGCLWILIGGEGVRAPPGTPQDRWGWLSCPAAQDPASRPVVRAAFRRGESLAPWEPRLPWLEAIFLARVDPAQAEEAYGRAAAIVRAVLSERPADPVGLWTAAALRLRSDPAGAARDLAHLCRRFPRDVRFARLHAEALRAEALGRTSPVPPPDGDAPDR